MKARFAQDAPQWSTRVKADRSQQGIMKTLRRFGVRRFAMDDDLDAIGFDLNGSAYMLRVRALPVRQPDRVPWERRSEGMDLPAYTTHLEERARAQAWRIYHDYVEGVVKHAWFVSGEAALLPFLLVAPNKTLADVPVPDLSALALPAPKEGSDA